MLHRFGGPASRRTLARIAAILIAGCLGAQAVSLALRRPVPDSAGPRWRTELATLKPIDNGEQFFQPLSDGGRVELTLDPRLQRTADRLLAALAAPYAGAVVLSVQDGRVLALAGRSTAEPERTAAELTLRPWAPAASVFKLVTVSALVEAGVSRNARVCYHGGLHSVEEDNLADDLEQDQSCHTLAYGLARSQNAIIGRLAHDHLSADALARVGRAFDFGVALALEVPVAPSAMEVPPGGLPFARVAAGFWQTSLSPLHGAYLAATLARGGETPPLRLVERVVDAAGNSVRPPATPTHRAVSEATARTVGAMMVGTSEFGSARVAFRDHKTGRHLLPGIPVAGKTGSLNRPACGANEVCAAPFVAYSWFVGFAPAAHPEVAFAVLLGNGPDAKVKASEVARDLLAAYFARRSTPVASR